LHFGQLNIQLGMITPRTKVTATAGSTYFNATRVGKVTQSGFRCMGKCPTRFGRSIQLVDTPLYGDSADIQFHFRSKGTAVSV
jgi:hypothetical protein